VAELQPCGTGSFGETRMRGPAQPFNTLNIWRTGAACGLLDELIALEQA
jgi:hypothetical protein